MSVRTCDRCTAETREKRRCTRRTCIYGPFCWQHTNKFEKLKVASSVFGGRGLFCFGPPREVVFRKSDIIAEYTGDVLTPQELERIYPGDTLAEYTVQTPNRIVDAKRTNAGVARYANDCRGRIKRGMCNAEFVEKRRRIYLRALRNISSGDEILVSYGEEYWRF